MPGVHLQIVNQPYYALDFYLLHLATNSKIHQLQLQFGARAIIPAKYKQKKTSKFLLQEEIRRSDAQISYVYKDFNQ